MRTSLKLTTLAVALLLATAAGAYGATSGTYRGTTSQGLHAFVIVKGGVVQSVNVPWKTHRCKPNDSYQILFKRFLYTNDADDPIEQSGSVFSDSGRPTLPIGKRGHAAVTAHLHGRFKGTRVAGTEKIGVRTRDNLGRHACTANLRWSARLVKR